MNDVNNLLSNLSQKQEIALYGLIKSIVGNENKWLIKQEVIRIYEVRIEEINTACKFLDACEIATIKSRKGNRGCNVFIHNENDLRQLEVILNERYGHLFKDW